MYIPTPTKIMPPLPKLIQVTKKLQHYVGKAIHDFNMIQKGDRVMVCVSGGKDSLTLLLMLNSLRQKSGKKFELFAFILDQQQPGWDDSALRIFLEATGIPFIILSKDTYSIVKDKVKAGNTYCSLCSRLRRGNIYQYARENGYNKVALGHHRDDLIETLLMSMMFNGQIQSMPPKLLNQQQDLILIRPLAYCQEQDIAHYAKLKNLPIIPCNLCGAQENLMRQQVKAWLKELTQLNPKIPSNMLHALQKVNPSQLMDKQLWDFNSLEKFISKEAMPKQGTKTNYG